jgi:hypothetical protein
MYIENKYKIWYSAALDDSRPAMQHVIVARPYEIGRFVKLHKASRARWETLFEGMTTHFLKDKDAAIAVATDGFILSVVPVSLHPGDQSGPVLAHIFKEAMGRKKQGATYIGLQNRKIVTPDGEDETVVYAKNRYYVRQIGSFLFPDFVGILPENTKGHAQDRVAFDRHVLNQACNSLGTDHVKFQFTGEKDPVYFGTSMSYSSKIEFKAPFCMLMPMYIHK